MVNPFFKNCGPIKITEILNILNLSNNLIDPNFEVTNIDDLFNATHSDITFFILKNIKILQPKLRLLLYNNKGFER